MTRAERAGCLAVAVTVDRNGGRNQETLFRLQRTDTRDCSACHDRSSLEANYKRRPMYEGVDLSGLTNIQSSAMTWEFIKRLRDVTKMKMVIKGILAHEDAALAVRRASTRSSSRTTARAARTAGARPSTRCRKSSRR